LAYMNSTYPVITRQSWADLDSTRTFHARVVVAREFAAERHLGQTYGISPYTVHLDAVRDTLEVFGVTDPEILVAGLLHDILEDTNTSESELELKFGTRVCETVKLVTDPQIKSSRKERHKISYPKIAESEDAVMVKLADRISNVHVGSKNDMYRKEHGYFLQTLYNPNHSETIQRMWVYLNNLL
jgi:guanosine-3',5'-bis(diphosphate) 3'-pyrophosphohydrolase